MVFLGVAGTAAEWFVDSLSTLAGSTGVWHEKGKASRSTILSIAFARLVSNLSRYIAAYGYLESVIFLLKSIWFSTWITPKLETQLRRALPSFARYCGSPMIPMTLYWTMISIRNLRQYVKSGKGLSCVYFALSYMRKREDLRQDGNVAFADLLNTNDGENFGVPTDEYLSQLASRTDLNGYKFLSLKHDFWAYKDLFVLMSC